MSEELAHSNHVKWLNKLFIGNLISFPPRLLEFFMCHHIVLYNSFLIENPEDIHDFHARHVHWSIILLLML